VQKYIEGGRVAGVSYTLYRVPSIQSVLHVNTAVSVRRPLAECQVFLLQRKLPKRLDRHRDAAAAERRTAVDDDHRLHVSC